MGEFESELDREPALAGVMTEQLGRAGDALQHCVAVGVQARGGAGCVLGFVEEHPQCLPKARGVGRVHGERAERRGDEFGCAVMVLRGQRGDFQIVIERESGTARDARRAGSGWSVPPRASGGSR